MATIFGYEGEYVIAVMLIIVILLIWWTARMTRAIKKVVVPGAEHYTGSMLLPHDDEGVYPYDSGVNMRLMGTEFSQPAQGTRSTIYNPEIKEILPNIFKRRKRHPKGRERLTATRFPPEFTGVSDELYAARYPTLYSKRRRWRRRGGKGKGRNPPPEEGEEEEEEEEEEAPPPEEGEEEEEEEEGAERFIEGSPAEEAEEERFRMQLYGL